MSRATRFWHPFADMAVVEKGEFVLQRGEGVWLWDEQGRRYLDATASLWYCAVGYGRRELAEVAAAQLEKLSAYSAFGDCATRPALELAERVAELAPMDGAVVFFTSGGSEGIETAAKLARRYWNVVGRPERRLMVVREGAFHGMNTYGTSLAGIDANAAGYGELVPGVLRIPADNTKALAALLEERGSEIAALFGEPVRCAAGVRPPKPGYWPEVQQLCREHNVLLAIDEVVTGFGRLGGWFGSQRYGIEPDLMIGAKGITSGYMPLGVVLCGPRVQEPFWDGAGGTVFRHGFTYSGHAAGCAVALANLDVIKREGLIERVRALEPVLASAVTPLVEHPLVGEVRCVGLLAGVEIDAGALAAEPDLAEAVVAELRERGVLSRTLIGQSVQISPPFVITAEEIALLAQRLREALDAVWARLPAAASAGP